MTPTGRPVFPREISMCTATDGASWDFLLIQPAELTPEQSKAVNEAEKKLSVPRGARFFEEFRALIAEHTDTFVEGPTTVSDWLKKLDN